MLKLSQGVGTTVSVGANIIANTTALFVGNSTVNTVITQNTLQVANAAGSTLFVAANGNIGINNITPSNKFNVRATSNTQVILNFLENNDTGTGAVAIQRFTAGTDKSLTVYAAGSGYSGMYGTATAPTFFYDFDTHVFRTLAGTTQLYIASNTNVGIGNSTPADKLTVEGNTISLSANDASTKIQLVNRGNNTTARFPQFVAIHYSGNTAAGDSGGQPVVELIHARGSVGSILPVQTGDVLGGFNTWGSNSTTTTSATRIHGVAEAAFTTTATAAIQFLTTNAGTQAEVVRFSANGNVGIGNSTPNAKLLVGGNVWIKPNESGANAIALSLGRFSDTNSSGFDFITDDATSDSLTIRSNRYNGYFYWTRNSGSGLANVVTLEGVNVTGTNFNI